MANEMNLRQEAEEFCRKELPEITIDKYTTFDAQTVALDLMIDFARDQMAKAFKRVEERVVELRVANPEWTDWIAYCQATDEVLKEYFNAR